MKYPDGQEARLGDRVKLGKDDGGMVVASVDTGEYSSEYPKAQWNNLEKGVLISFPQYGLIHYEEPQPGLQLLERAKPMSGG